MLKSGFYNILSGGARLVIALLSLPLMIKLLGTNTYGMYAVINSVAAFVAITESSLLISITIFISRFGKDTLSDHSNHEAAISSCFQASVILSALFFLLFYFSSFFITPFFIIDELQQSGFLIALQICAGQSAIRLLQQFFAGLMQAHHQFGEYNAVITVYTILLSGGSILVAYWYPYISAIFTWQLLVALLLLFYYYYHCRKSGILINGVMQIQVLSKFLKPILIHCGRTWPGLLGGVLFAQGDKLIVGRLLGLDTVGIYSILTGVVNQINTFSALPVQPIISYLRNVLGKLEDKSVSSEILSLVKNAVSLNTVVAAGLGLAVIDFAPELTSILVPESAAYSTKEIALFLAILGAIYAVYSMNAVGYYVLFATGREIVNSIVVLLCGMFTVVIIWLLSDKIGLLGAVVGNIGYFSSLFLLHIAYKQLQLKPWSLLVHYVLPMLIIALSLALNSIGPNLFLRFGIFSIGCLLILLINKEYIYKIFYILSKNFKNSIKKIQSI